MAANASAWHSEAQRLKTEIKSALEAYPSPSPVPRSGVGADDALQPTPPDDNIVRLQQQINQVHDFVHDTERKDLMIQDLRVQVAQLLKERQQAERSHEGSDAQLELARRDAEAQRQKLEDAERHQGREAHDAGAARRLLEKRVGNLEAEKRQMQTELIALVAQTEKMQADAQDAGGVASSRDNAIAEAVGAQTQVRKLRQELDEARRRMEDVRETGAALEQKVAVNEMRAAALTTERDGLRQELSGLRDDLSAASSEAAERNQAKAAGVQHQRAAEAAQAEILKLQSRLSASEDEKASGLRKLEARRKEFEDEHARYEAKAKAVADAMQQVASLSASESDASRLRMRVQESEAELADSRRAAAETGEKLSALGLRFETSEGALHSAARVIQAALEDALSSVEPRSDSEFADGSGADESSASIMDDSMSSSRSALLKQAGSDAGVLASVCSSVGEICRELRRSERRTSRAEAALRGARSTQRSLQQEQGVRVQEVQSAEHRLAAASATSAAQAAALQKAGREVEEERTLRTAAELELRRRHEQFGRAHQQLCAVPAPREGEAMPEGRLSWGGLMEDMSVRILSVAEALRLEQSRHALAVEAAAHAETSLARVRNELRETGERSVAAARRSTAAHHAAAAAHTEQVHKAVTAERKRAEEQVGELVEGYGEKIRAIEAEFTRGTSRVEAAEMAALAKSQLVEESNRQVAETERRASVLQSEAERCNEHAADMERRAASASKMQREAEASVARAESERGAVARRCMQLEGELTRSRAQIERLMKDLSEANVKVLDLDQRVSQVGQTAAQMQEDYLTQQAHARREADDERQAAQIRVRTDMESVIKGKDGEISELRMDVAELRKAGAASARDHDKITGEVQEELLALAAQHREVVGALETRDAEANDLQASVAECEGAATLLASERDELVSELQLATDGEAASTRIAGSLHKECAARAEQLESARGQMAQQTEQVRTARFALFLRLR